MQFYTLIELCEPHFRELCQKMPYLPHTEAQPKMRHGFCFYHETPYEACREDSKHFVYMVTEPVDLRLMASAKGGAATSEAKRSAAIANGTKGGRPPKNPNLFRAP